MPANHRGSDAAIWQREYNRQLQGIKGALHSLRLQSAKYQQQPTSRAAKQMAFTFAAVEAAFQALNAEEPAPPVDLDADPIPAPKGRRQFISDLRAETKACEVSQLPSPDG